MGVLGLFKSKKQQPQNAQMPGQPGEYNEDLAAMVDDEYSRRQAERKPFELQWRLNMEFINGNQYLDINPVNQAIEEIPKFYWHQEREVFNQMGTIIETRLARLTRQRPTHKTRPASSDEADLSAAKVSSMLLNASWYDQDMDESYSNFVAWLEFTGTALWKPVWNTKKGRLIYRGKQPKPPELVQEQTDEPDKATEEVPTPKTMDPSVFGQDQQLVEIREGDLDTAVVPAHEFFPDSSYRNDLRACRSVIHARAYHIGEIEEMWGQQVEPEDVDVMTLQIVQTGMGGMGYSGTTFRSGVTKMKNHAVVKEYYERPCLKYPEGRFIVVASKKTLYAGPMPYSIGPDGEKEIPFVRCVSIDHPGCFWGKTIAERLIPVQRRYNAFRNRKAEYLNLVTIGQWYEPEGSIDEDSELNNAPGNRIKYRPGINGAKPEPVSFPNLPSSFEMEEQTLLQELTAISGVSELSRFSQAPSGVKSGRALGIANEQDDTRVAITATNIANSVTTLGKYWIRLFRQFVQEPRLLRTVGFDRDVEVREWTASDLRSDDVFIENAAALAESPAQRRQMVFDLLNAGLFVRPELSNLSEEARQKVFEMLEYGHIESEAEDMYWLQKNRARRENMRMAEGQMAPVMDFDDDAIHIEWHNRQRMGADYEMMLQTPVGPIVDQMMRLHLSEHQQRMAQRIMLEQQQQQQQQQGPPKGGPPK